MNNIEKEFVPYQESLELKSIGFDEPCFAYYYDKSGTLIDYLPKSSNKELIGIIDRCSAPLYQQAFRFFREKYGLHSYIKFDNIFEKYSYTINDEFKISIPTHEEAELACLRKLIQIVKEKL